MPANQTPANTEGYEGFFHLCSVSGDESNAKLVYIIRDHDIELFQQKKAFLAELVNSLNEIYGAGTVSAEIKDSYFNMKEKILPHMHIIENAVTAMKKNGVEPKIVPIRGGTDGAQLSFMGLPCPNMFAGGINFHSRYEFVSLQVMEKAMMTIVKIIEGAAKL